MVPKKIWDELSPKEREGWEWLYFFGESVRTREYTNQMSTDDRVARRHLSHFVELNIAEKTGAGPITAYKAKLPVSGPTTGL